MTRDVLISISGIQFDELANNDEPIEVITTGEYFKKNDKNYVLYEEPVEGYGDVTKNTIKFSEDELSITRRGAINVQMIFHLGIKTVSTYSTPFGNIFIGVDTSQIDIKETAELIQVHIEYALDVNNEHLADCNLDMKIKPKGSSIDLLSKKR